jgi:hypothetical protein
MRLHFKWLDDSGKRFDGRGTDFRDVLDKDTGETVGFVRSRGVGGYGSGGIEVNLFNGKYIGWLKRADECQGFILGVQAVLNHMLPMKPPKKKRRLIVAPELATAPSV